MLGVALAIKVEQYRNILLNPKSAFLGISARFILLPALTFGVVMLIKPPPSIAMGMIHIAACPGGSISNFISSIEKIPMQSHIQFVQISRDS